MEHLKISYKKKIPITYLLQLFLQQMKYEVCVPGDLLEYGAHSHC